MASPKHTKSQKFARTMENRKLITFTLFIVFCHLLLAQKANFKTINLPFNSKLYFKNLNLKYSDTLKHFELKELGVNLENEIRYKIKDINFDTQQFKYKTKTFKYYPIFVYKNVYCYRKDQENDSVITFLFYKGSRLSIEGIKGEKEYFDSYIDDNFNISIYRYQKNKDAYVSDSINKTFKEIKGIPKTIVELHKYTLNLKTGKFDLIKSDKYFCKVDSRKYKFMTIEDDPFSQALKNKP